MTQCPQCGSTEIVPDLIVYGGSTTDVRPAAVILVDLKKKQESLGCGFRAAVCGACGHAELFIRKHDELLQAHKKGFVSKGA